MTVEAWHVFEVNSLVTPTTSTRFDWLATVCDQARVVPAVELVLEVEEAVSYVTAGRLAAAEVALSWAIAGLAVASLRSMLALTPRIVLPVGMLKPKFVASRLAVELLVATDDVAYWLLLETMFPGVVQPAPVPAAFALDVAPLPVIVTLPPTSTSVPAPVIWAPFVIVRQWFAATEPGIVTVSRLRHCVGLSW